jgi:hypothetical protein
VSRKPSKVRAPRILRSGSASRPGRKVSRWPARFPLSTEKCSAAAAVSGTACRTSCRSGPGSVPGSMVRSAFHGALEEFSGRNVAEVVGGGSPAAQGPCWSARCGARPRGRGAPESCRAAASDLPGRRMFRRTPRSCGPSSQKEGLSGRQRLASGGMAAADPPGDGRGGKPEPRMGPATGSAAAPRCGRAGRHADGQKRGRSTWSEELARSGAGRSGIRSLDGFHSSSPRCVISIRQMVRRIASRLKKAS